QALAFAAALRGIAATIVMPDHAPQVKVDAVRGYGASVVTVPNADRETATDRIISETGAVLVHPFEHPDVVAGQGTASLELLDDRPDIEVVVTPVGGGGLLSGTSLVTDHRGVGAVGVEPELVDDAARSLRDGVRHPATGAMSVGDGLLGRMGALAFAMLRDAAVEMVTVSEPQIMDAVRLHAQRMKLVVEPSGATVLAALLAHPDRFAGRTVGAVISGGNLDLELLGTS
ncbi:MAG: pyridoxal-phosphate dependent enzyme, partial [Acidimicrobiia bacterium]|nr:pyridoxal-phosphate dependent enzyme [Acidimicrobiia bacterium]